jgi:hypothetical protein
VDRKHQRRKIFIDRPIQLAVLLRTALYWAMCTMAQVLMVLFFGMVASSQQDFPSLHPQVTWHLQVTLLASIALLPILLWDVLKLSHRWVGPIFRLRTALRTLSRGETISPVKFRGRDFWQDLASDLNAVAAQLEKTRTPNSEPAADRKPTTTLAVPAGPAVKPEQTTVSVAP